MAANNQPKTDVKNNVQTLFGNPAIPYSQEAEEAMLGGILINPNSYYEVVAHVKAADFFILRNRYIFEAMQALTERKEPLDLLTLSAELKSQNRLDTIGGAVFLNHLCDRTPTSMHTAVYAQLVQRASIRRRLLSLSDQIKTLALDESVELSEVIERIENKQIEVISDYTGSNTQGLYQALSAYYAKVEKLMNNESDVLGILTGFHDLDHLLMGFDEQSFSLLGARPGMGKTSLMLSTALNMAKTGRRVAYFSMEMGIEQIMTRLVAMESGINGQRLRGGKLGADEWGRFVKTAGDMNKLPIFVDDTTTWTPLQLHAKCSSLKRRLGIDIIMLDYVGLMSGGGRYQNNKVAEAGYISRALKGLARDLRTPVWGAIQLNRNLESRQDKRPVLSDLRESGDWEQDADNVLFIYRDEVYNEASEFPNQADIIVAKHRNGPVGTASLYFEKSLTKFMNPGQRSLDLLRI